MNKEDIKKIDPKINIDKIIELEKEFKRIKNPLRMYGNILKRRGKIINIKQPLLLLKRKGRIETYEGVRKGIFKYTHSDGKIRYLHITPRYYEDWDYFGNNIKVMFATEDGAFPFSEDPLIDAEEFDKYDTKIRYDTANYRAKELTAQAGMWWKILLGVAAILGVVFVGMSLIDKDPVAATEIVKTAAENVSRVVNSSVSIF